jgi:nicotinamidase-related amidase
MGKVFVIIDFQNDFVTGSLGFPDAVKLDKKILKRIMSYWSLL